MGTGRDVHLGSSLSLWGELSPVAIFEGCYNPAFWLRQLTGIGLFESQSEKLGQLRPERSMESHTENAVTPLYCAEVPIRDFHGKLFL